MVDFIKITNAGVDKEAFLTHPLLSFTDRIYRSTGEIIEGYMSAKYKGMMFFISTNGIPGLSGSLHKYYNDGLHNYNDFTFDNLKLVIEDLYTSFGIDPQKVKLNNVEFGVNLEVPFNPDDFIDHLVTHNYTPFNIEKDKTKTYAQVRYEQFYVKIYNKGLQYNQGKNILRFEVKIVRMAKLAKNKICFLRDLLDLDKLSSIMELLLKNFDQIIYWDESIDVSSLSSSERELIKDGYNPNFWKEHHKRSGGNASKKFRHYQSLVRKHGPKNFHSTRQLISDKWISLLQVPKRDIIAIQESEGLNSLRDITVHHELEGSETIRDITSQLPLIDIHPVRVITTLSNNNKSAPITSSYILSIDKEVILSSSKQKICLVTGLDISMQKDTSRFLSTTGIRYYQNKDPGLFKKLQERLTDKWVTEPLDKQISEIAHSIRNAHHSKRIHTKKAIKRLCTTPALFNNYDLVSQEKKNIANQ